MMNRDVPCCAAEAMRRVRPVVVNGATVGLSMLDLVFSEVRDLGLTDDAVVRAELIRRVKMFNYVPPSAAEAYAAAVYQEYMKYHDQGGIP
ncbi:MAG TPA: hypothetical protein PK089_05450 [Methanoregulaceae archaeon]|nr:hypothetical protein [Methanoregulaceae archaeon]